MELEKDNEKIKKDILKTSNNEDSVTAYAVTARNFIVSHALSGRIDNDSRYDKDFFYGVMTYTGYTRASSDGLLQYRAYCLQVSEQVGLNTELLV